jgi:hypothetical protein
MKIEIAESERCAGGTCAWHWRAVVIGSLLLLPLPDNGQTGYFEKIV